MAAPVLAASLAYACAALATLNLASGSVDVGATVQGTGAGFSNTHGGAASAEPVAIRINKLNAAPVWT
ncbi:MAG: hypothetical protein ACRD0M_01175, partial [Acidimicrobiales bacterium]